MTEAADPPKRKKAKPKPKFSDKEQSERFIETARELVVEESGKEFDRAMEKLVTPPRVTLAKISRPFPA